MSTPTARRTNAPAAAVALFVGVALVALTIGPLSNFLEGPSLVERITFVNDSEYDVSIDVTASARDGWMSVGTAQRRSTSFHEKVIDQGGVWIFRFAAQGHTAGELQVTRAELEGAGWTVRIPDSVGEGLRAKGAPPTP